MDLTVKICGSAGDGVQSIGDMLTNSAAQYGINVFNFRSYGAEIRARGDSDAIIRMADFPITSFQKDIDVLISVHSAFSIASASSVKKGGLVIFDNTPRKVLDAEDSVISSLSPHIRICGIPMTQIAQRSTGISKGKNVAALGAFMCLVQIPKEICEQVLALFWKAKGDTFINKNITVFRQGYQYAAEHYSSLFKDLAPPKKRKSLPVFSGNQALAKGALAAGCKVYAGYPITPATPIFELLAKELPKNYGKTIQTEDEIAAIGVVLGASFTGVRAMTATSGPGLSLMIEQLGLATMAEIPCVLVCVQRGGPSTGLPTKTEQSDLNLAIFGAHGDTSRIVLAPTNVYECYTCIIQAFDYAQRYQVPVIVLSDFFLANRRESVGTQFPLPSSIDTIVRPKKADKKDYQRYKVTENGISPMALPGEDDTFFTATGLEHNPKGVPTYTAENHTLHTEKRFNKIKTAAQEITNVSIIGNPDSDLGIISWGSTMGAVTEAITLAEHEGIKIKALKTTVLWPLPEKEIREFADSVKKIIIPELNYQGQLANLFNFIAKKKIIKVNYVTGTTMSSFDILEQIKKVDNVLRKK